MPDKSVKYIRLESGDALPDIGGLQPFKAIVVIEDDVSQIWQWDVSRWLVNSGCRYMMAWGKECSAWVEAVDEANLEAFNYDVPEEQVVITTRHEDEELDEVFWFARHRAHHPAHELRNTLILHISGEDKQIDLENLYENA
jgi:hypothetical protein